MSWWKRLWRRRQMEAQLEKELSFHLEQHTPQWVARGRAPDKARRQARLALGSEQELQSELNEPRRVQLAAHNSEVRVILCTASGVWRAKLDAIKRIEELSPKL
jgi:hypothetical protein